MKSMTGFGSASAMSNGHKVTVEISSVNSKKSTDIRCNSPQEISAQVDSILRPKLQKLLNRGSITVVTRYELNSEFQKKRISFNEDLLIGLYEQLQEINAKIGGKEVAVTDILRLPGVIVESQELPLEDILALVEEAFTKAYSQYDAMRTREGEVLANGLGEIINKMEVIQQQIVATLDKSLQEHHQRLRDRIRMLGVECSMDDERLLKEIAFCAEKMDIAEELLRLQSHFVQFREFLVANEAVGRSLEFLCQEIGREINTLGAKVANPEHSRAAIVFRNELDRLSEQVRNVE